MKITNFSHDFFENVNKIRIFFIFLMYDHGCWCYQGMMKIYKEEFVDQARQGEDRARGDQIAAGGLPGQPAARFSDESFLKLKMRKL